MNLYPAIDIMNGQCVRLFKGDFNQVSTYPVAPLQVAKGYAAKGAAFIHVVDLDGARTQLSTQAGIFGAIARETGLKVQAGGGIRSAAQVKNLLAQGVERVVVGSIGVTQPEELRRWLGEFGPERITFAVDVRWSSQNGAEIPKVTSAGWKMESADTLWAVLDGFRGSGLKHILCTDIRQDGTLAGPSLSLYGSLLTRYPELQIQASGGIGSLTDIRALKSAGVAGAIVGKALFEGRFGLEEALQC
jgi:phosphoribosylformimino-5-aminoimidazole carboxamide ribotide isomerase